jgi:hypothetical protein
MTTIADVIKYTKSQVKITKAEYTKACTHHRMLNRERMAADKFYNQIRIKELQPQLRKLEAYHEQASKIIQQDSVAYTILQLNIKLIYAKLELAKQEQTLTSDKFYGHVSAVLTAQCKLNDATQAYTRAKATQRFKFASKP